MCKRLFSVIASAPFAAVLALASASVTLLVAVEMVTAGQVPSNAGLELIAALLLAAVATSEVSRPQRRDRDRRRQVKTTGAGDADSDLP